MKEYLYKELVSEKASIWFINESDHLEIRIKASTVLLFAIIQGAPVYVLFSQEKIGNYNILLDACIIFDSATNPCVISGVVRRRDEHLAIKSLNNHTPIAICLYNELDMCVAHCLWYEEGVKFTNIINFMNENDFYHGKYINDEFTPVLDNFERQLNSIFYAKNIDKYSLKFSFSINQWKYINIFSCTSNDVFKNNINTDDEGNYLESLVGTALNAIFQKNVHKKPEITNDILRRELTDVISYYNKGFFLFESKALSSLQTDYSRPMERKTTSVNAQIKKGIRQLIGAVRKIRSDVVIKNSKGEVLVFDRTQVPHCIVVVSELFNVDHQDIVIELMKASVKSKSYFHVVDLTELLFLIKAACHETLRPERFDVILTNRFNFFCQNRTINFRSKLDIPFE